MLFIFCCFANFKGAFLRPLGYPGTSLSTTCSFFNPRTFRAIHARSQCTCELHGTATWLQRLAGRQRGTGAHASCRTSCRCSACAPGMGAPQPSLQCNGEMTAETDSVWFAAASLPAGQHKQQNTADVTDSFKTREPAAQQFTS